MKHYFYLFVLFLLPGMSILIPGVYGEDIVYRNASPTWYSYDCSDSSPGTWTQSTPRVSIWKYFGYYDGECHATLQTFSFDDMTNLQNTTSIVYQIDSRSMLLTDLTLSDNYVVDCNLFYFDTVDIVGGVISETPTDFGSFDCTGGSALVIETLINYSSSQIADFETNMNDEETTLSWMVFPNFNSSMRSNLDSNSYTYAIGNYANKIYITGEGFNCAVIEASSWCNFYEEPWEAVKKALGEDYIGQWFYILVFMPLPMSVFLISRNGAYAGFVCLPIMLVIHTIEPVIFEISLSMLAIASAFGFYELLRKKLME